MSINTTETMLSEQIKRFLLPHTFNAAVRAGAAVMRIYEHRDDYDLSKYDGNFRSITAADRAAHEAIKRTLGQTRIPILSEDGREMHYEERCNWELFWLVDPLDGTREFIAGNNEFTINIALMENNVCAAAVIYVPYLHKIYFADRGFGSYVRDGVEPSADAAYTFDEIKQGACRLPLVAERHAHPLIAISRSHNTPETFAHVEALRASLSRRPSDRAGQFLQILPAGRRAGRLLRPHDPHLRVGYGRRRTDPRRSGRTARSAGGRRRLPLQQARPAKSVVRLPRAQLRHRLNLRRPRIDSQRPVNSGLFRYGRQFCRKRKDRKQNITEVLISPALFLFLLG